MSEDAKDPLENVVPVPIEEEMRRSYLDYAMSVIISRALPDIRDGLKPVHRRILYAMMEAGWTPDKPHRKSSRIVGDVMGKYHPHGDAAIYDAMVRMAQTFSMRLPLIDGQGNFGSVDGDPPAAMRYTEARLAPVAMALLADIDKDTVDFQPNYDESEREPTVLPAAFPNLLVNGASGIAVGMATNIPTHNPREVIDATLALIDDPDLPLSALMDILPGPDFPTGGIILGRASLIRAYTSGRGSIVLRARTAIEEIRRDRQAIVVREIPYQVNKAALLETIAELVRNKEIEGIADLRDESDREGLRVVIELKREATPEIVLNQLFRRTQLQTSFGINMLALDHGRPRVFGLKEALEAFIAFREEVILRRARFDLEKAREQAHLLAGLVIAVQNIDRVIALIRQSPDAQTARAELMREPWPATDIAPWLERLEEAGTRIEGDHVYLSEAQARGILELRLQRLTGLERGKLLEDLAAVATRIGELHDIIARRARRLEVMKEELLALRAQLDSPRLTTFEEGDVEVDDESMIEPRQMVVTLSRDGFIKATRLDTFRAQRRGGRGRTAAATRGDDVITRSFIAHTHQWVLFFSSGGKVFREKVWRLPEGGPGGKGRALVNFLPELGQDTVTAVLPLPQDESLWDDLHLVFATASGLVRRNRLSDFRNVRAAGLIAMRLRPGDRLIGVATCREGDDVLLATRLGRALRFQITEESLRVFAGREASGVRGIRPQEGDEVISLSVLRHVTVSNEERQAYLHYAAAKRRSAGEETEEEPPTEAPEEQGEAAEGGRLLLSPERLAELEAAEELLLTVTDGGFGKRSSSYEFRVMGRGGLGVTAITLSPKSGEAVVATFPVRPGDHVMAVTDTGRLIRLPADQIRITGRAAIGVRLVRLEAGERVSSVFPVVETGEEPSREEEGAKEEGET
jgi:DNA gyrase subunit A